MSSLYCKKEAILLIVIAMVFIFAACRNNNSETNETPNILFIMSDDHAWQAISAYESEIAGLAPTPNIDRLAKQGMRFNRCLVTNSICGPSRATILTGKYGHINGFYSNEINDFNGEQQTFPKLMQKAGYQTALIGKWHLGSLPTGFDYWDILPGQGHYYNPDFINSSGIYTEEGYVTDIITDKILNWLKNRDEKRPFVLLMHHKASHREWEPALKNLGHFKNVTFPYPETLFNKHENMGTAAREAEMSISRTMRIDADLKMWADTTLYQYTKVNTYDRMNDFQRKIWNDYYCQIKEEFDVANLRDDDLVKWKFQRYLEDYLSTILSVDESVGKVLDYLKNSGLDKNTIVIYTSDQGFYLGENGWFDKRFMYEVSCRTPLLISWPNVVKPASVNNDIVSNLDFAETFLDVAGIRIPNDMQGESILPLLKGKTPSYWRSEHYYHYYAYPDWHMVKRHYGITTKRYKLIHFYYDIDEWELYDLQNDPLEINNEYNNPEYEKIKFLLHKQLEKLRLKFGDSEELQKSLLPENPDELKAKYTY